MPGPPSYDTAFARLRDVFTLYQTSPGVLVNSLELGDRTRDASRAALAGGVPFVALCAEFGRVAAESLPHDRMAAIRVGRAMMRWAGPVYDRAAMAAG